MAKLLKTDLEPSVSTAAPEGAAPAAASVTTEDGRVIYEITDKAPPYIAGRKRRDETEIALSEAEARAEVLAGHLWPKGVPRPPRKVKAADEASADAGAEGGSTET